NQPPNRDKNPDDEIHRQLAPLGKSGVLPSIGLPFARPCRADDRQSPHALYALFPALFPAISCINPVRLQNVRDPFLHRPIRVKLVRIRKSLLPAHPHTANKEFLLVLNSLFQQNLTPVLTYLLSHASHFQNRFVPSFSIHMLFSAVSYRRVQSYQKKDSHCSIFHNNT